MPLLSLPQYGQMLLNSYGMVFFTRHRAFTLLLLCITFLDPWAGLAGLISVFTANFIALWLGLPRQNILNGDYGFNALIVGLGLGAFYSWSWSLLGLVLFGALLTLMITVMLQGWLTKYHLPFLSLPFVFSLWILVLATRSFDAIAPTERGLYYLNELYAVGDQWLVQLYQWFSQWAIPAFWEMYLRSLGAILFQFNILSGFLLAIGLFLFSRIAFSLSLIGFGTAFLFYHWIGADLTALSYNYIGFNFILSAIAIGGFYLIPSRSTYLWVIVLIPVLVLFTHALGTLMWYAQLGAYALPFNLVVIGFLYLLKWRERYDQPPLEVVHQQFSPERNLYAALSHAARFQDYRDIAIGLPVLGEWTITQAHDGEITHKEAWKEAWDFMLADGQGRYAKGHGTQPSDYFGYGKPVIAPAAGTVVAIDNSVPENAIGDTNLAQNWGNTIILQVGLQLYVQLSHLKKDSLQVEVGDTVTAGEIMAQVGNSGRSPEPHLHMQIQTTPYIGAATYRYPLAGYLAKQDRQWQYVDFDYPTKNLHLQKAQSLPELQKAFYIVPGQTFTWEWEGKTYEWVCETDMYNHLYLHCTTTDAKAWFVQQDTLFYGTHYQGKLHTLLHHFFLATYKVPLVSPKGLEVADTIALHLVTRHIQRWWHDLWAPLWPWLQAKYALSYQVNEEGLSPHQFTLSSAIQIGKHHTHSYTLDIAEGKWETLTIHHRQKTTVASCVC